MQKEFKNINELFTYCQKKKFRDILMNHGSRSFYETGAERDFERFREGFNSISVCKRERNVEYIEAKKVFDGIRKEKVDCIVSIGGGGVIDFGKVLKEFFTKIKKIRVSHFVIPTTAGTGSERTCFAVAYKNGKKISIENKYLLPEGVLFLPEYILKASKYHSACSLFDGMSQAIESIWANSATATSRKFAYESLGLYLNFFDSFISKPTLKNAEHMQRAATLSGKAINISKTTGAHALSYFLTSDMGIPHGYAVALLLNKFFIFNFCNGSPTTKRQIKEIARLFQVSDVSGLVIKWKKMMAKSGLKCSLKEKIDIDKALSKVNLDRMRNNPVSISKKNIIEIYSHL